MLKINEQVKYYRALRGFTQKELSKLLNVIPVTISQYESGRVKLTLEKAVILCQALNISLEDLTGFKKSESSTIWTELYFSGRV